MTEEREALRTAVRELLADRGATGIVRGGGEAAAEAWRALASLGVTGVLVPESLGGMGLGLADVVAVVEELGRVASPLPFISTAVGAGTVLALLGGPTELATAVVDDEAVVALALLEPGRRWETTPTATVVDGRLTGTKVHVTDGAVADQFLVSALEDGVVGLWLVARGDAAVSVEDQVDLTRPRATVSFDGAAATTLGGSLPVLERVLDVVSAATCADAVASAQAAFDMALAYTRDRVQFGKPIGAFQGVQQLCVDMFAAISLARQLVESAVTAVDDPDTTWQEAHREVVAARAWVGERVVHALEDAVQVFGGIGFTWEHDVGLHYKRSLSLAIELGTAADHLDELATALLG